MGTEVQADRAEHGLMRWFHRAHRELPLTFTVEPVVEGQRIHLLVTNLGDQALNPQVSMTDGVLAS